MQRIQLYIVSNPNRKKYTKSKDLCSAYDLERVIVKYDLEREAGAPGATESEITGYTRDAAGASGASGASGAWQRAISATLTALATNSSASTAVDPFSSDSPCLERR